MKFSEVASLISKLNSQKNVGLGHHFLLDGSNVYCFFIKSIKCENPYVPYQQPYFYGSFPLQTPALPPNSNLTYSSTFDMELVKKIPFKTNSEGKVVGILSVMKELIVYCKDLKTTHEDKLDSHNEYYYDRVLLEFVDKIEYEDLLENLPMINP